MSVLNPLGAHEAMPAIPSHTVALATKATVGDLPSNLLLEVAGTSIYRKTIPSGSVLCWRALVPEPPFVFRILGPL